VLRRILVFGPKRDEVTGRWRYVHIEEFHNLHSSPSNVARLPGAGGLHIGYDGKARRKETARNT
jgi:hypothetical protein